MKIQQRGTFPSAEKRLGALGRSIDELLEKSRIARTVVEVRDEIATELKRVDRRYAAVRAQIDQDLAATKEDLVEAFNEELDVWKGRMEELEVQATLGRMELRDLLVPALGRLDAKLTRIRKEVDRLDMDEIDEIC
jgi:hypothetical protein